MRIRAGEREWVEEVLGSRFASKLSFQPAFISCSFGAIPSLS